MIQAWLLDEDNYFIGESTFVEESTENMTTEPLLVGYIKAKWTSEEWIEGATEEEIQAWKDSQPKEALQETIDERDISLEKQLADLEISQIL